MCSPTLYGVGSALMCSLQVALLGGRLALVPCKSIKSLFCFLFSENSDCEGESSFALFSFSQSEFICLGCT